MHNWSSTRHPPTLPDTVHNWSLQWWSLNNWSSRHPPTLPHRASTALIGSSGTQNHCLDNTLAILHRLWISQWYTCATNRTAIDGILLCSQSASEVCVWRPRWFLDHQPIAIRCTGIKCNTPVLVYFVRWLWIKYWIELFWVLIMARSISIKCNTPVLRYFVKWLWLHICLSANFQIKLCMMTYSYCSFSSDRYERYETVQRIFFLRFLLWLYVPGFNLPLTLMSRQFKCFTMDWTGSCQFGFKPWTKDISGSFSLSDFDSSCLDKFLTSSSIFVKKFWIKKRSSLMVHCDWEDLPGWKKGPCR